MPRIRPFPFLLVLIFLERIMAAPVAVRTDFGPTAVPGITVGHVTLAERPTGCTVVMAGRGAVGGVDVRGSAPGTRETDLLDPVNLVDRVNAVVLAGGSAFGLDAATGVVRYLEERGLGFHTDSGPVPIVPAAILYDLGVGGAPKVRPGADCGYEAARKATRGPVAEGNVGAGAGATVGKLAGLSRAMRGGLGVSAVAGPDGVIVGAIAVVNALGDVVDPSTGRILAGTRTADGRALADARLLIRSGDTATPRAGENTTLAVVATDATLTKSQATKVAQVAHDGLARAIRPVHTVYDGDAIFVLATGSRPGPVDMVRLGELAADAVAEAIVRGTRAATGLPGLPAARDLEAR